MKTNKQETKAAEINNSPRASGFFGKVRAFLSQDGEYLTIVLPGNMLVRKHVNFFKAILGVPYKPKAQANEPAHKSA